jgi:predicted nucleic acid-binding protein
MPSAIANTSPLLYLGRISAIDWLPRLFQQVWTTNAVLAELREGARRGYDVIDPTTYAWLQVTDPRQIPPEWLSLDLGKGEISAMALAQENPSFIVLLDDLRAREIARAAGLTVWGTLRVLLEAKQSGLIPELASTIDRLSAGGMYLSNDLIRFI